VRAAGQDELRVLLERRQAGAVGRQESLPGERDQGRGAGTQDGQQSFFKLAAGDRAHAQFAQEFGVHRGV
jgi:hypothetical protein